VTYFKTMGVVKNIIPAVASTNAIISAMCVNEAVKLLTYGSQTVNNYYLYMGTEGLYTPTFVYDRSDTCMVCSDAADTQAMTVPAAMTLQELMDKLNETPSLQLKKPSIRGESTSLFMQKPPSLAAKLRVNLSKPLAELIEDGEVLTITDPALSEVSLSLQITFEG
jgi:ubiquitin-activating enzyme E1 C